MREAQKEFIPIFSKKSGLNNGKILYYLASRGPNSGYAIARGTGIERTIVNRRLRELEDLGFLVREEELSKKKGTKYTFWLTIDGCRACAFLGLEDDVLSLVQYADADSDGQLSKKTKEVLERNKNNIESWNYVGPDRPPLVIRYKHEFLTKYPQMRSRIGIKWAKENKKWHFELQYVTCDRCHGMGVIADSEDDGRYYVCDKCHGSDTFRKKVKVMDSRPMEKIARLRE